MDIPGGAVVKNLPANARDSGDTVSIPVSRRSLEKGTATHSNILAWEIPWTEEPGSLQSMELQRVGYDLLNKQQQHVQLGCTPKACKPDSFPVLRLNKDLKHSSREINNLLDRGVYMSEPKVLD